MWSKIFTSWRLHVLNASKFMNILSFDDFHVIGARKAILWLNLSKLQYQLYNYWRINMSHLSWDTSSASEAFHLLAKPPLPYLQLARTHHKAVICIHLRLISELRGKCVMQLHRDIISLDLSPRSFVILNIVIIYRHVIKIIILTKGE